MIRVQSLTMIQGSFALRDIRFEVPRGAYVVLMGPTGCGKTSIIEALCGLRPIVSGDIMIGDRNVAQLDPAERGIGYVPQDGAMFTTMTVRQQIALPLRVRRRSRADIDRAVTARARDLGIHGLLDRTPRGLSGGERQRVALARALVFEPDVLCLDEPLSALDERTRHDMCDVLEAVRERTGVTTLHVTHNSTEAQRLADITLRLADGAVQALPDGGPDRVPHDRA